MPSALELLRTRFSLTTSQIAIADWRFELYRPANPDDLISDLDFDRDGRLPYWAELWPSAIALAEQLVARSSRLSAASRLLELGCGLGLVSLAAIRAGFEVVATDYYEEALALTVENARHNGLPPPATRLVDWRKFPDDLGRFDLVVASDVLFEKPNIPLIVAAFSRTLAPAGRGLLTDPGRPPAAAFSAECERHGLTIVEHPPISIQNPDKPAAAPQAIRCYELSLAGQAVSLPDPRKRI